MNSNPAAVIRSAFLADALNLGPHWVYNQSKVARVYPEGVKVLSNPASSYHPEKRAGDFTHYGDQMMGQLRSFAALGRWDQGVYEQVWKAMWQDSKSYMDASTTETLARLSEPSAPVSMSNDLAGAARALLVSSMSSGAPLDEVIADVRLMTSFTHGDPEVIDTAELFVRVENLIVSGKSISDALQEACQHSYQSLNAESYLEMAQARLQDDPLKVASDFGLTCHNPEALPLVLFFLLRFPEDIESALSLNALAGGDNAARAIPLAILLTQANGWGDYQSGIYAELNQRCRIDEMLGALSGGEPSNKKLQFTNDQGSQLDAVLELPSGRVRGYAIFAHCFTCGQSFKAAREITAALARRGIGTLRFDFTGLGRSEGDFAETSFLTNVDDLVAAGRYLEENYEAPFLLVGHSLGGAAVLSAAHAMSSVKAVATVGAPADPAHVEHLFEDKIPEIKANGKAVVELAGRSFEIGSSFLDAVSNHCQADQIATLNRDLLIMHAPSDTVVGIENAGQIYTAAKHPKSFISLTNADHLLLQPGSAEQAAGLISTWAARSL